MSNKTDTERIADLERQVAVLIEAVQSITKWWPQEGQRQFGSLDLSLHGQGTTKKILERLAPEPETEPVPDPGN